MNARAILCACMAGLVAASQCLWAQDDPRQTRFPPELTDSALREGVWIWRSGHILPEREIQKVVRIRKSDGKWDLTVFWLSHTRESIRMEQPPQVRTEGPYPIHVTDGVLNIVQPQGVLKYSCRFYNGLLQFPAVTRTDARTFHFTVSEANPTSDGERDGIDTWSYTWTCSSNPSDDVTGTASRVAQTPRGRETTPCAYSVEGSDDGPALIFRHKAGTRDGKDRMVWHRKYFGPQIFEGDALRSERRFMQPTYTPADDSIKKQIPERMEREPHKPDARDG